MTAFGEQTLAATVHSDPARFLPLFGLGPALPPERCGLLLQSGGTCDRLAGHKGDCDPDMWGHDPEPTGHLPQVPASPAPGAAQESDPAAPPAGGQPGAAPGAEQGEADPAVEHTTDAGSPMAPCLQPMAHGMWEDARGPLPSECDVPEHHEDAPDAEARQ